MGRPPTLLLFSLLPLVGCATGGGRPGNIPAAEVEAHLTAPLFFGSSGMTAANFEVDVTNTAAVSISVRRIQLSTTAMTQYAIRPTERLFRETLAPGETKAFHIVTDAITGVGGLSPTEPMNVRALIDFESGGTFYRDFFTIINVSP